MMLETLGLELQKETSSPVCPGVGQKHTSAPSADLVKSSDGKLKDLFVHKYAEEQGSSDSWVRGEGANIATDAKPAMWCFTVFLKNFLALILLRIRGIFAGAAWCLGGVQGFRRFVGKFASLDCPADASTHTYTHPRLSDWMKRLKDFSPVHYHSGSMLGSIMLGDCFIEAGAGRLVRVKWKTERSKLSGALRTPDCTKGSPSNKKGSVPICRVWRAFVTLMGSHTAETCSSGFKLDLLLM